ncbi:MAG: hypothetical protein FJX31_11195, partial [Alphaproteobacteria bacterium]|nr:hypothetical protein [Alphaproteobacteria bacterium]
PESGARRRSIIKGRDLVCGVPHEIEVSEVEIVDALGEPRSQIHGRCMANRIQAQ